MLRVSVSMKAYYLELTGGVRCGGGHEGEMDKFEESLMQMLKVGGRAGVLRWGGGDEVRREGG